MKKYYAVGAVERKKKITQGSSKADIDIVWADGMAGVLPVFDNILSAEKYSNGKFQIIEFTAKKV